jgi:hypothetical protein
LYLECEYEDEGKIMIPVQNLMDLTGRFTAPVPLPETRFTVDDLDPPYWPPPYSSMLDDVIAQKYRDIDRAKLRRAALHPVMLKAGKARLPQGELGRPAAPDPVHLPELLGGRVLYTNI